jgi:hypothetical protein
VNPKKYLRRLCSPLVASSSPLVVASLPLSVSACSVGCCIVMLCLVVRVVPLRRSVASPCHVALRCVVTSRRHDTSSRRLVVLSRLASSLRRAPLRISSHLLCSVGCCVVALRLVLASPRASRRRDLPLCRSLLSRRVSSRRRIASRHHVPSCSILSSGLV